MAAKKTLLAVALLVGIGVSLSDLADAQSGLVVPRVETRAQPPTPTNGAGTQVEGWAVVRYTVLDDGLTSDVRIVDILPPGIDPAPITQAVEAWVFTPGRNDGEPIDWFNTESVVAFSPDEAPPPLGEEYADRFDSIGQLIEAGNLDEALTQNEQLLGDAISLIELGLALAQQGVIYQDLGDLHSAIRPLRLATDPRMPSLPLEELLATLQLRFQVEAQLGRKKEALDTFQRISYALEEGAVNPLQDFANELTTDWETTEALPVLARVDDEPWRITAARRTFTVANIEQGEVQGIRVECDRRATYLEFQPDAEWSLPDSWGNCELFVEADSGTTFVYVEFLDAQPAAQ